MKKLLGFLIPIVGIFLLLRYIGEKPVQIERRETVRKRKSTYERKAKVKLNSRQEEILKLFNKREILLPTDIYSVAPDLSTRTLRRDMDKLVELDLVIKSGSTKDTKYILKKEI